MGQWDYLFKDDGSSRGGGGTAPNPYGKAPDFTDKNTQNPYDPNERVDDQFGYQTGINGEKNYDINLGMTGGLMDTINAINDSKYANNNYNVRGGRATNREVNQNELSQYQLQQMLASNSPLMKQAAAQGLARGGSRGLMNSSLATGASQGAMISGAQPFALQDASWYGRTAADNMDAMNRMEEANLGARTSSMQARANRDQQILAEQLSGYGDVRKAMIGIEDREDTQRYGTGEREGQQDWNTGEREGTQEYKAAQDELNRTWTSNENALTNTLAWSQSKLDAATKMGISRGQALADMATAIWSNPDKKFSKRERENAIRMVQAKVDEWYPGQEADAYERSYDPATGKFDESLRPDEFLPDNAVKSGGMTITENADGTRTITAPSGFDWSDYFNSLPS